MEPTIEQIEEEMDDPISYFYHTGYLGLRQLDRARKGLPVFVAPLRRAMTLNQLIDYHNGN